MAERKTTYQKLLERREFEKRYAEYQSRYETTLDELLQLMLIKGKMGVFQSFDPREFGADYDIVNIPRDTDKDAAFWNVGSQINDYQNDK